MRILPVEVAVALVLTSLGVSTSMAPCAPPDGQAAVVPLESLPGQAPCCSYLYQPCFCMDHELRGPAVPYCPQPGDLFLATDHGIWAKLGHKAALSGAPQHSGIVIVRPDGSLGLLESGPLNTLNVEIRDLIPELQCYAETERVWIRKRRVPLTPEQSALLTQFAFSVEGKRFALLREVAQLTPFRTRGTLRTYYLGRPHGLRSRYFCSELVMESCVAAGLLHPDDVRPSATYPREIFFGTSTNCFLARHLDLSAWDPPARWTLCPGTECHPRPFPWLDGDTCIPPGCKPGKAR